MVLENIQNNRKRKADGMRIEQDLSGTSEAAISADTPNDENLPTVPPPPPPPQLDPSGNVYGGYSRNLNKMIEPPNYHHNDDFPVDQDNHPYVGLVNQAMTCYLNSLIQTLYMTPEFRNVLYEWQYNGTVDEASRSIPFQLQKLFALLQTSNKNCLETKDLTASFGWEGQDAYEQHDVQELSRVMLEALEHRFRKSEQHRTFIQNLYKGTLEDYVKCHGCNRESVRQDIYNDLALAVRDFGATESYKSIEEALKAFTTPEILSGNNKYKCENCNSYQEAEKGLRFSTFPYLLAIQMKRFTLDYSTGFRVKLNDRVTFPDYLDLNEYMNEGKSNVKSTKMSYAAMATKKPETIKEEEEMSLFNTDSDGWINKPPTCEEVQAMLKNGKYVYELFAVLIHQGSATGGHYFAYVKNLEQSKWLCFNDTQVKSIDTDEIKKCFGGTGWCNNMNAYMMVYRQIDAEKNQKFMRRTELPGHLNNWLKQWEDEENRQAFEKNRLNNMVKVKVLLNDERILTDDSNYGALECSFSKDEPASEIVNYFSNKFTEMGIYVDPNTAVLLLARHTFNFAEGDRVDLEKPISDYLTIGFTSNPELYFVMELKPEDCELPDIPDKTFLRTLDFLTVDVSYNTVRMCKRLAAYDSEALGSLRDRISKLFPKCSAVSTNVRMVMDVVIDDGSPLVLVDDDSQTLTQLLGNKFQIPKFYIDCGHPEDLVRDRQITQFTSTQMCKIIEKRKYGTRIRIQLPSALDYRRAGLCPPSNLFNKHSDSKENDSPPVSPISKKFCQLGPLNENQPVSSEATNSSTAYTRFSDPQCLYTNAPTTPSISVSSPSGVEAYDPLGRFADSITTFTEYGDENKHPNSPIDGGMLSEDEMDIDNYPSNAVSPNVSDNESNYQNENKINMEGTLPASEAVFDYVSTELTSDAYEFPNYTVDVLETGFSEMFFCNYVTVLIDHRQLTTKLVEWIARYLKLHPDNIALAKHYNDTDIKGYDITLYPDETIKVSFASVNRITVSLRVPTKEDERLIRVIEFDLNNENMPDQWPILFSVPASPKTTFEEFKQQCLDILESAYAEKYPPEQIRLRELTNSGCPCINLKTTFEQSPPKEQLVALQKLKPEEVFKQNDDKIYQPIIVRRFCPSTLEIMAPFEVMVPVGDPKIPQILKNAIASRTNLVPERIALSEFLPKGAFARWPYSKSPLDLYDIQYNTEVILPVDYPGKLVYFVDNNEPKKNVTEDDRRAMRIRERISSNNTQRRTERPLRIQMSSISEDQ